VRTFSLTLRGGSLYSRLMHRNWAATARLN